MIYLSEEWKKAFEPFHSFLQTSALHASSLSQAVVNELLKDWGHEGFFRHVEGIEAFYRERRDALAEAAERHLRGLATWSVPKGGMFLWIKVEGVEDTWSMIMDKGQPLY